MENLELETLKTKLAEAQKELDRISAINIELHEEFISAKAEIDNWKRIAGERESWFRTAEFERNNMFADLNDEKKLVAELKAHIKSLELVISNRL